MSSVRRATIFSAIAAISLMGATCGGPDETPTVTPTPTPTPTVTPLVGLHAPVATGQTLTVYNGYDHPLPDVPCPTPGTAPLDHCGNQEDGLDLIPSKLADPRILAPVAGSIAWEGSGAMACLVITPTGTTLGMDVCHFAADQVFVTQGEVVTAGQVLGLRDPGAWWIHLSLDDRSGAKPYPPVAFDGPYAIEGVALPAQTPPVLNLYCGMAIRSTTPVAADDPHATTPDYTTYEAAPAPSCATPQATSAPTPTPAPVLSGAWVAPKNGAKVTTSILTLSAKPTVTPATLSISKVAFNLTWGSASKKACSATKAGSGGAWSCKVDLWKIGAPLGKLSVSFDVTGSAGDVAEAPAGTRTVTFAAPPPPPTGVKFKATTASVRPYTTRDTVSWKASALPPDTTVLVYGITACYATRDNEPCLKLHMPLKKSDMELLGQVKASKGSFGWVEGDNMAGCTGIRSPDNLLWAVVVIAANDAGNSRAIIAADEKSPHYGDTC